MKLGQKIVTIVLIFFISHQSIIFASYSNIVFLGHENQLQSGSCLRPTDDGEECGGFCSSCYGRSKLQATEDTGKNSLLFRIMSEQGLVNSSGEFCRAPSSFSAPSIVMATSQEAKKSDPVLSIKKTPVLKKAKSLDALSGKKRNSGSKTQESQVKKPRITVALLAAQVAALTDMLNKTQKENSDLHKRIGELEYQVFNKHRG
jgi:hypothetical protein